MQTLQSPQSRPSDAERTELSVLAGAWLRETARHKQRVAGYIRRMTREPAEVDDLLAETWASAWCAFSLEGAPLPDERSLIAHARLACARWKAAHRREAELSLTRDIVVDLADSCERQLVFAMTVDWLRELPRQQRYAIVFRQLRGADFKEVAATMGCSVSAAKTHYWRAVEALRCRGSDLNARDAAQK
jgi:DNA-directed RNA polymerase specialized sigma24 family protein